MKVNKYRPLASPDVDDGDVRMLNEFMAGKDLTTPDEAIRLLCILRTIVARTDASSFPNTPCDCFCEKGRAARDRGWGWQDSGDELRFIIAATEKALRKVQK